MKFTQPLFPICKRITPLNGIMAALMLMLSTAQAQPEAAPKVDETTQQAIKQVQQFMDIEMPKILREKQREVERLERERIERERLAEVEFRRIKDLHQQRLSGDHSSKLLDLYQINSNGTVTDKVLNLTWMRCSLGQFWTGRSCDGEAKKYSWEGATQAAQQMRFADHSNWRLPTIEELKSLVYCSKGVDDKQCATGSQRPTLFQSLFPNTSATFYWSASPTAGNSGTAWGVYFYNGDDFSYHRSNYGHVRLVHSGQ